jgi:predicted phage terminase large subunit-like protein
MKSKLAREAEAPAFALTPSEYRVVLRNSLPTFIERVFAHLDPQTHYAPNWHIDLLADKLTQVASGSVRRLIINVPPRSLKSICASVAFPAWVLGRDPAKRLICASYGQDLANKLARDTHTVMTSDWYQRAFDTRLMANRSPIADYETTLRGGRMATSVGGVLTGRGGDILIIDDPVKPDEALSESQRQLANNWFDNTLYSRLNNKATGAIVIIMQRLHLDDLVGHVLPKEDWEVVSLPAIAEEAESWEYQDVFLGTVQHRRAPGDVLHPAHEPLPSLLNTRNNIGEYAFSAQYQQTPVPLGGALVKQAWLSYYNPADKPARFDKILQSWDTASKVSEISDYSVCTTWGIKDKSLYLLHALRKRLEYPDLKRLVVSHMNEWAADTVLIEDKASGIQLAQELSTHSWKIKGVKCEGDKVMRLMAQTAAIENGRVFFPKEAPWLRDYINELLAFPMAKYDDQVDSTAQALKYVASYSEPARELKIRWAY